MTTIYTIGYTGTRPEQLAATVHKLGAFLLDIRYNPRSRVPQWQGAAVRRLVGEANYKHARELGNANYRNGGPIELADPDAAVPVVRAILAVRPVVLLCACKDWRICHRREAAEFLAERLGAAVEHLSPPIGGPGDDEQPPMPDTSTDSSVEKQKPAASTPGRFGTVNRRVTMQAKDISAAITNDAVAVYARVSTEDQAERQTIQAQLDFLRKYADLHQICIAGEYVDDGISGTVPLDERPEGRRLLDDADAGRFGAVIVYRLDRLGRSLKALIAAHDHLDSSGVAIRSGTEPFDTSSPIGRFVFQLLGSIAELEKETIIERTSGGRNRVAKEGRYAGGALPPGYDVDNVGKLVPSARIVPQLDITESELIRDLFARIAGGSSVLAEARRFQALGVSPDRRYGTGKVAKRGAWATSSLTKVLHNPLYKGEGSYGQKYGTVARAVPPLVDTATWGRVQAAMLQNKRLATKNARYVYPLRGLIRCEDCGRGYTGTAVNRSREPRHEYRCGGTLATVKANPADRCKGKSINAKWLEAEVWAGIRNYAEHPGDALFDIQRELRDRLVHTTTHDAERRRLIAEMVSKEGERERILTFYRKGVIATAEAEDQLGAIGRELATLREMLEGLRAEEAMAEAYEAHVTEVATILTSLREQVDEIERTNDTEWKRRVIQGLVCQITVQTDAVEGATRWGIRKTARVMITYAFKPPVDVVVDGSS
jgi:site-specific DNA recombinase